MAREETQEVIKEVLREVARGAMVAAAVTAPSDVVVEAATLVAKVAAKVAAPNPHSLQASTSQAAPEARNGRCPHSAGRRHGKAAHHRRRHRVECGAVLGLRRPPRGSAARKARAPAHGGTPRYRSTAAAPEARCAPAERGVSRLARRCEWSCAAAQLRRCRHGARS